MPEAMLRTVTGPVPATAIDGAVLPREHLRTDMRWATGIDSDPYRWLDEDQTVTTELPEVRQSAHLSLIIDLTQIRRGAWREREEISVGLEFRRVLFRSIDSAPYRCLDEDQTVTTELREVRQSDHLGLIIDLT